jgi:hypothetical protein
LLKYKKRTKEITQNYLSAVICDWCGDKAPIWNDKETSQDFNDRDPKDDSRPLDLYGVNDFEFYWKTGACYPETSFGEKWVVDLCNKCRAKLMQLMQNNGIKIRKEDWDY